MALKRPVSAVGTWNRLYREITIALLKRTPFKQPCSHTAIRYSTLGTLNGTPSWNGYSKIVLNNRITLTGSDMTYTQNITYTDPLCRFDRFASRYLGGEFVSTSFPHGYVCVCVVCLSRNPIAKHIAQCRRTGPNIGEVGGGLRNNYVQPRTAPIISAANSHASPNTKMCVRRTYEPDVT